MSELRALTKAFRSLDSRITGIEDCLVVVLRNSEEQVRAIKQVQEACGAISSRLVHLVERIESLAANQWASDKELRKRMRELETGDEVTQT